MPDPAAAGIGGSGEIRAAGGVLWRRGDHGVEVALIHRDRYDDWTFPKGKCELGEHALATAVREISEETGIGVTLGRCLGQTRYDSGGRVKLVDFWAARSADRGAFVPNDEVDAMEWVPVAAAPGRLTYQRDSSLLAEFTSGPAETVPIILLRHASAGSKRTWHGDDLARPLDPGGAADAERLAPLLACFGSCRVISSPAKRCAETVAPYAALISTTAEIDADLSARPEVGASVTLLKLAGQIVEQDQPTLICAHGENLPVLLAAICTHLATSPPSGPSLRKAAWWVLHVADGTLLAADRYDLAAAVPSSADSR
jgi:8-oxo-dGTP diphosphatase